MPTLRLIPIVLFATASLFALKAIAFLGGESVVFGGPQNANAQTVKRSWAQEMLGYPDITGSVSKPAAPAAPTVNERAAEKGAASGHEAAQRGDKESAKPPSAAATATPEAPAGTAKGVAANAKPNAFTTDKPIASAGERTLLEQLQQRRQELDARDRELEIREGLLKTAEQRIEARLSELKEVEAKVDAAAAKKDEAEAARLKGLVTMYENMKPKDAAKIFDRLDLRILIDVATQINPRRMSDILAAMSTEAAERLTVELATRAPDGRSPNAADLPKIEGRPRT